MYGILLVLIAIVLLFLKRKKENLSQIWFKQYFIYSNLTYYDIYMHTIFLGFDRKR